MHPGFIAMGFTQAHAVNTLASNFLGRTRTLFEEWLHASSRGKNVIWLPLPSLATPALVLEACHANTERGSFPLTGPVLGGLS